MEANITVPAWATHILSDHTDMERNPHPVDAARVSSFRLELPDDVYYEYAFRDAEGAVRADPANPERGDNPWYPEVSVLRGPDYAPHPLASPDPTLGRGETVRHRIDSSILAERRRVAVYTPYRHDAEGLPLLVLQDGNAYARIAGLPLVFEALLEAGEVRPARLAFVEPIDRSREYAFAPDYRRFTFDELLPRLRVEHPSTDELLLMGASLGGLFSLTAALEHPDEVAAVALQSGALLGTPEDRDFVNSERSWILDTLRERPRQPFRVYSEVGTVEWLTDVNRDVHTTLEEKGYDHAYDERSAGHNWTNWRNGLAAALRFLLAPD